MVVFMCSLIIFFKQKTAYGMRISDWSSDVCSSDLIAIEGFAKHLHTARYSLAGTADYERYIGILDAEYGKSERRPNGDCTYRIWESGQMVVRGEHCTNEGSSILFVNRVASNKLLSDARRVGNEGVSKCRSRW